MYLNLWTNANLLYLPTLTSRRICISAKYLNPLSLWYLRILLRNFCFVKHTVSIINFKEAPFDWYVKIPNAYLLKHVFKMGTVLQGSLKDKKTNKQTNKKTLITPYQLQAYGCIVLNTCRDHSSILSDLLLTCFLVMC